LDVWEETDDDEGKVLPEVNDGGRRSHGRFSGGGG
jgi:hypothetical protein